MCKFCTVLSICDKLHQQQSSATNTLSKQMVTQNFLKPEYCLWQANIRLYLKIIHSLYTIFIHFVSILAWYNVVTKYFLRSINISSNKAGFKQSFPKAPGNSEGEWVDLQLENNHSQECSFFFIYLSADFCLHFGISPSSVTYSQHMAEKQTIIYCPINAFQNILLLVLPAFKN